ncbi:MAG TPA: DUF6677 family protein [Candidatus Angelobacter sp.]|jgi:hypothetical protein|nr:DUF6677 family protein [Candidatus Angelobacter sp.]
MEKTETTANQTAQPKAAAAPITFMAVLAPALGWLIPGAGHIIQKHWIRGLLLMVSIVSMFAFGIAMDGKVYKANTGDLLDILGFVGDVGAGGLYILSQMLDWGRSAIAFAVADYGTKFIVVSGLLNIMAAVDAYHIAIGRKK